jgi:hypothetical protein
MKIGLEGWKVERLKSWKVERLKGWKRWSKSGDNISQDDIKRFDIYFELTEKIDVPDFPVTLYSLGSVIVID